MPRPFHVHWRHRGEVVCGATMTAAQHAMRLLEKHGYPQDAKDELMAIITGLRGGV